MFALAFASPARLFIGTTKGRVFRADRAGTAWTLTQIDNAPAGPLGLTGLITDVAVDWADATLASVYVTFGGMGIAAGSGISTVRRWASRSGSPRKRSAGRGAQRARPSIVSAPQHVYVGADIGVWHSSDSGATMGSAAERTARRASVRPADPPDAAAAARAATHGRGVCELALSRDVSVRCAGLPPSLKLLADVTVASAKVVDRVAGLPASARLWEVSPQRAERAGAKAERPSHIRPTGDRTVSNGRPLSGSARLFLPGRSFSSLLRDAARSRKCPGM